MFNAGTHTASLFSRVWVNHLIPHSGKLPTAQIKKEIERTIACAKKNQQFRQTVAEMTGVPCGCAGLPELNTSWCLELVL